MEITNRDKTAAHVALLSLTLAMLVRTAWISDEALITLQCAVRYIHGYGPVLHVGDQIQSVISLWLLTISGTTLIARNAYAAALVISMILSLVTVWLLISRLATSFWAGMLAGTGLVLSKAFIDFSTSGLENPLSHLLLVLGLLLGFRCLERADFEHNGYRISVALFVLMLLYLCRPDLLWLVLPFILLLLWRSHRDPRTTLKTISIALAPLLAWCLFNVFFYRVPFSKIAYVQVGGAGSLRWDNIWQGTIYLVDSLSRDPITLTYISLAVLLAWQGPSPLKVVAVGVVLYLVYLVGIGGSSMSGRFLTTPLVVAAVILSRAELSVAGMAFIAFVFATLGAISLPANLLAGRTYSDRSVTGQTIRDERGFTFPTRSLATSTRDTFVQSDDWTPSR
jgi:arabinofuranosyltransferase